MNCTFVRYHHVPAPCHGDDDPNMMQVFRLKLNAEHQIESVKIALENRYGGYIQLWECR